MSEAAVEALFRVYETVGKDGYPPEWHETVKHLVREEAGHRCVRCLHPYSKGDGEWSKCDENCTHGAPVRSVCGLCLPASASAARSGSSAAPRPLKRSGASSPFTT